MSQVKVMARVVQFEDQHGELYDMKQLQEGEMFIYTKEDFGDRHEEWITLKNKNGADCERWNLRFIPWCQFVKRKKK